MLRQGYCNHEFNIFPIRYYTIKDDSTELSFYNGIRTMKSWVTAFSLSGIGFFMAACIIGGTVGGHWLDEKYDASPAFLIIGILSGILCAGLGVYGMVKPLIRSSYNREKNR